MPLNLLASAESEARNMIVAFCSIFSVGSSAKNCILFDITVHGETCILRASSRAGLKQVFFIGTNLNYFSVFSKQVKKRSQE